MLKIGAKYLFNLFVIIVPTSWVNRKIHVKTLEHYVERSKLHININIYIYILILIYFMFLFGI